MASKWFPLATILFLISLIRTADGSFKYVKYDVCPKQECIWDPETFQLSCNEAGCTEFPTIGEEQRAARHLLFQRSNFTDLKSIHKIASAFPSGVKTFDLSHNNLITIPPGTFKVISRIDVLDLSYNHIRAFEDEPLKDSRVKKLLLNGNQMDNVQTSAFRHGAFSNTELEELEIKDNIVMFIEKDALRLISLKKLSLAGNLLESIENLDHLGLLEEMDLHDNQIKSLDDGVFKDLVSLKKLDLSHNYLMELQQDALKGLSGLKSLNLDFNKLIGLGDALTALPSLQSLSLRKNHFKMIGPHIVKFPRSLRNITIEYCKNLRRIDDYAFRGITNLQNVEINSNPDLAAISHNAFQGVASLQRLSLRNNALIVIERALVPWTRLDDVDLSGNHWHCDCHLSWVLVTADQMPKMTGERIVCSSPSSLAGMAITSVSVNDMTCPHGMSMHSRVEVGLLIPATSALLIVLALIVIRFRHSFFPCCRGNTGRYSALYNIDDAARQGNVDIRPDIVARQAQVTKPDVV